MNLGGLIRVPAEVYNEYIEFNLRKFQAKYAATDSNFNTKSNSTNTSDNKRTNSNSNNNSGNNNTSGSELVLDSGGSDAVTSIRECEDTLVNKEDI